MSETCPGCGTGLMGGEYQYQYSLRFACDSTLHESGEFFEGEDCIRAQRDQLRKLIDQQPKTKDGVPVVDGMTVYPPHPRNDEGYVCEMAAETGDYYDPSAINFGEYYSTREAAMAAEVVATAPLDPRTEAHLDLLRTTLNDFPKGGTIR